MRQVLVMLLISALNLAACAPALAPLGAGQAELWRRHAEQIAPGTVVKVRLTRGDRLTGVLVAADDSAIEVNPKTRIPEPIRRVPFDQIAQLEVERAREVSLAKLAAISGAVGGATGFGMFWLLLLAYDD